MRAIFNHLVVIFFSFLVIARRSDIRMINLEVPYSVDLKLDIETRLTNVVDVAVDTIAGNASVSYYHHTCANASIASVNIYASTIYLLYSMYL